VKTFVLTLALLASALALWRADSFRAPPRLAVAGVVDPGPSAKRRAVVATADRPGSATPAPVSDTERYAADCRFLRDCAERAPADGWEWLRQNADRARPDDELPLAAVFLRHLAARDPGAALALANASLADADANFVACSAVNGLLEAGRADLAQNQLERWAAEGRSAAVGSDAFRALALYRARESDESAAQWALHLPPSHERAAVLADVAAEWTQHDPRTALAWASGLTVDEGRADALAHALRVWSDHDPLSAAEWVRQNEALPEGDRLVSEFVRGSALGFEHPQLALQWVALIRDSAVRRQSFSQVLARWEDRAPAEVRRFLASNGENDRRE
jgi:hypothetical protein